MNQHFKVYFAKIQTALLGILLLCDFSICFADSFPLSIDSFTVFHRSGQTFLVWQVNDVRSTSIYNNPTIEKGGILQPEYLKLFKQLRQEKKNGKGIKFKIYRSDSQLTIDKLTKDNLIGEVKPLSAYYPYLLGMSWSEGKFSKRKIPRLSVNEGEILRHNSEVFVFDCSIKGNAYYAVIPCFGGKDKVQLKNNYLNKAVKENVGTPEPVFQWSKTVGPKNPYVWNSNKGTVYYYSRWISEPYSNMPQRFLWSIAVPDSYTQDSPVALQLGLHAWGSSLDSSTYWYNVKPSTIRIATVNYPIQDWWYGYREKFGISDKPGPKEVVQNYTEKRLLSFIDWVKTKWDIDDTLIFAEGQSMGGAGAMHLGMKHGNLFAYLNSWVGIASWRYSDYFRKGESSKWGSIEELSNYNGVKFDDWMDLSWWLKNNVKQETPFLSFANGKNDGAIGWEQAVKTLEALVETKRPFAFMWGMNGHGQRAKFMMDSEMMRTNKSLPAFRNCSLDNNPGTAAKLSVPKAFTVSSGKNFQDIYDGDSEGQMNTHLKWQVITDISEKYEIRLMVSSDAPEDRCIVDMTPRRLQQFRAKANEKVSWRNMNKGGKQIQSGVVFADQYSLVTLEKLVVSKAGNRILLNKIN